MPAGTYCNDDVANLFGNRIPQPPLTPRTANPTRYRNLDAGRGAIGEFALDTTTLGNGPHTVGWSVKDMPSIIFDFTFLYPAGTSNSLAEAVLFSTFVTVFVMPWLISV